VKAVLVTGLVLVALGVTGGSSARLHACAAPDSLSSSWEAVFGHDSSSAGAEALRARLVASFFQNATLEQDGCGDIEVEVPGGAGLDTEAQRKDFLIEARQQHFTVHFEAPCCYTTKTLAKGWYASFGKRSTLEAATALELRALSVRFSHLEIERTGPSSYVVVLPGGAGFATAAGRASFAAEARSSSAHLSVTFMRL
jgi:hypothetical protein